jgi:threonine aldolase
MSRQTLLCIENTHNHGGGSVCPAQLTSDLAGIAHDAGLAVHMDGARVFNASVASGVDLADIAAPVDTLSFCLSKGLGAPVGSLLCGPSTLIDRARRFRHMLGGGWRQAGMLAAAGLYALDHHVARLADDHRRARRLAEAVSQAGRVRILAPVETNIVLLAPIDDSPDAFAARLASRGVRVSPVGPDALRAVLHLDVGDEDLEIAIRAFCG